MRRRAPIAAALVLAAGAWLAAALHLWGTDVPSALALDGLEPRRYFTAAEIAAAEGYERFVRWNGVASTVVLLAVLGGYARWGTRFSRESAAGPIGTGILLGMLGLGILWLAQVPSSVAGHWWDRRHGLTEVGYVEFLFGDWMLLGSAFLSISFALAVVMALARRVGRRWWIPGAAVFVGLGLLFAFVTPYLLPPTEPVRGPLAAEARELAREQGVADVPVRVEEVSAFTDLPNAYAAGLGPSRVVVLWDTLVDRFERGEVLVVVAHEFAHHARDHIWKAIGWYALLAFPGALVVAWATRGRGGMGQPAAVPLGLFVLVVLELAAQPLSNAVSRRFEAEADWAALQATRDPEAARRLFEGFTEVALSQPNPPTWSYLWLETHPTVMQRIAMAEAWRRQGTTTETARGSTRNVAPDVSTTSPSTFTSVPGAASSTISAARR